MKQVKKITKRGFYLVESTKTKQWIVEVTIIRDNGTMKLHDLYHKPKDCWVTLASKDLVYDKLIIKNYIGNRDVYSLTSKEMEEMIFLDVI